MSSDRLVFLLTKQLSASLSAEEEAELQQLLLRDDNRQSYYLLKKYWKKENDDTTPDVEKALTGVLQKISEEKANEPIEAPLITPSKKRSFSLRKVAMLATVVVLLAAGFLLLTQNGNIVTNSTALNTAVEATDGSMVEKQNAKGTRSIITLADGSKVWLNADSKLQYPVAFEGSTREVWLSGEAFFDVAKNKQKPFIIHLKKGTVKVLGTSFNIKAYDNSPSVETSVATGRVVFIPTPSRSGKKADSVVLTKDKKAVYSVTTETVQTLPTSSAADKAWTEGKLIFNNSPMIEIAETLERNFGKEVIINDEELRTYRFTGPFENDRLEDILYYLSKSKPFTYRITETQVILSALR